MKKTVENEVHAFALVMRKSKNRQKNKQKKGTKQKKECNHRVFAVARAHTCVSLIAFDTSARMCLCANGDSVGRRYF